MALPAPLASPTCVACSVDGESVFGRYSREERDALMAGRVVTDAAADHAGVDGAEATTVAVAGIIRQPAAQVWATLVDFPSRPRFQPGTKDVHVVRIDGDQVWLAQ